MSAQLEPLGRLKARNCRFLDTADVVVTLVREAATGGAQPMSALMASLSNTENVSRAC